MKEKFVTVTGINHYLGTKPFKVNRVVKLVKEQDNDFDTEAIRVDMPYLDTVGYVANSPYTVFEGTLSAGRLYDLMEEVAFAQVMFITPAGVIAKVLTKEEAKKLVASQSVFFEPDLITQVVTE